MTIPSFAFPRSIKVTAILGACLFLAACSPAVGPVATGGTDAGQQTVELVTWLSDTAVEQRVRQTAVPAMGSGGSGASGELHRTLARQAEREIAVISTAVQLSDDSCGGEMYPVTLATYQVSAADVASGLDPAHEINSLTNFLYGLPRGDAGPSRPYDGDL